MKSRSADTAHNVRDNIAASAQRTKENINAKLDNIKRDHNR
jgi:hypothetical protein